MRVRVQHHPHDHPYVARLPKSSPPVAVWDVGALVHAKVRIVHLHFGFETKTLAEIERWVDALRADGIRLVHTIHDVDNPHLVDQTNHHALLELLAARADRLLTLSDAAADAVEWRTGRRPSVVAHQHVVPLASMLRTRRRGRSGLYVHAATCRPNLDVELIERVARQAQPWGGVRVHVRTPLTPDAQRIARRLERNRDVTVELGGRPTDRELWRRIGAAHAVLLAYRWSTHSGILHAAHDLRVPVLAPDVGALREHGALPVHIDDVEGSIRRAVDARPATGIAHRVREHHVVVREHRALYAELVHQ
jgi:hypothetical protein